MTQVNSAGKIIRRKYRFKDRITAEAEYTKATQENHLNLRLGRALYAETVDWLGTRGAYRVGMFDHDNRSSSRSPKVVVVFAPKTGQEPDLRAYDAYEWLDIVAGDYATASLATDKEALGLVELSNHVRSKLWGMRHPMEKICYPQS